MKKLFLLLLLTSLTNLGYCCTPPPAITGPNNVCIGTPITLSDSEPGGGTWTSGTTSVATINPNTGVVNGVGPGSTVITFTSASTGCSITMVLTATTPPSPITNLFSVCAGASTVVSDAVAGGVWTSSNTNVATVTPGNGTVTGVSSGISYITYSISTCIASTTITVNPLPSQIAGPTAVCVNSTIVLTDSIGGGVWTTSNTNIATIDPSGFLTGATSGTVTVTYQFATGCSAQHTVTVNPVPLAITGNANICAGQTSILSDITTGGTWSSGSNSIATVGSLTGIVTGVQPGGITTISYTLNTGCAATKTFTVNPLPPAITGPSSICTGVCTIYTCGVGGTWSSSNTSVATINNGGTLCPSTVGNTVVSYTFATGCASVLTVSVSLTPIPIVGTTPICAGSSTILSDGTAGGTWSSTVSSVATVVPSGASAGTVSGTTAGTTLISYTMPTGCFATRSVVVNPIPAPITGANALCVGSTISVSDTTSGGTWSTSNTNASISTTGVVTGNTAGTSVISYILPTGCASVLTITVNALPTVISGNTTICAGQTTTLSDGTPNGTWSSSTSIVATVTPFSGVVTGGTPTNPGGITTITYTLIGTGCAASTIVTVNPRPPAITGITSICSGLTTMLSDAIPSGTWSSSNTTIATVVPGPIPMVNTGMVSSVGPTGTSMITFTLISTGCSNSTMVTVNPLPSAITGTTSVCAGLTTVLSDATPGGTWCSSNTNIATIGSSTGIVTGRPGAGGTVTITYTLASTGCVATTSLVVNPLPAGITGNRVICAGLSTTLSSATAGGTWSSVNTNVATVTPSTSIVNGAGVLFTTNTTIIYTLPTTCITVTTITVNPLPAAITGPATVCQGSTITLNSSPVGGTWISSNPSIATVDTLAGSGVVGGVSPGLDTITYRLTTTGCLVTTTIAVIPLPTLIIGGPASICNGSSVNLSDAVAGGTWISGNPAIATVDSNLGVVTGRSLGSTAITYSISGCIAGTLVLITPQPGPITGVATVCSGSVTRLSDAVPGGIWSSSNTLIATVNTIGSVTSIDTGTVVITYAIGACTATRSVSVTVQPGPITGIASICNSSTTTLSDATPGGTWSSNNTNVAIDSLTGVATGQHVGTSIIFYRLASGCFAARTITVNIQPAVITGSNKVCDGDSTQLSDATPGVIWSSSNVGIAIISSTGMLHGIAPGIDTVTARIGSCTSTFTVTVNPPPSPITGVFYICVGRTTNLSDLTPSGVWSSSNNLIAPIGAFNAIATGVAVGTDTITYTLPTGCIATHTLTVIATPSAIVASNDSVCVGMTIQLSDANFGGTWTSSNTNTAVIGSTGIVTGMSSGTPVITYTLNAGCYSLLPIVVDPLSPIQGNPTVCPGYTTAFIDTTVGGRWSSSTTSVATIDPLLGIATGVTAGTTTISYNLPTGCSALLTLTVIPLPPPTTGIDTVCVGSFTTLSDANAGGAWSSANTSIATVDPSTGDVWGVAAGSVTIIYQQGGCPRTTTVTVNPLPLPITGNTNICVGLSDILSDATPGGVWSSDNSNIATVDPSTGVVTGVFQGTANIIYTIGTGCSIFIPVTINPLPALITGPSTVCVGSTIYLTDSSPGGAWYSTNTFVATVSFIGGAVTGRNPGVDTIIYQLVTACRIMMTVTVTPTPAAITGPSSVCVGSTVTLSSSTGGAWTSSNTNVATIDPVSGVVSGIIPGTTTITYSFSTGCASAMIMTVNPPPSVITGNNIVCGSARIGGEKGIFCTCSCQVIATARIPLYTVQNRTLPPKNMQSHCVHTVHIQFSA